MINVYEVFEKPMIKILAFMEIEGIKINNQFLKVLSSKFEKKIDIIQKEVFKLSKKEFNIASPKQLGEVLYNDLKIADLKKTKKGSFATSASVLEDLAFKGHKFPKLIALAFLLWSRFTLLIPTLKIWLAVRECISSLFLKAFFNSFTSAKSAKIRISI